MLSAYLPDLWSVIRSKLVPWNTTVDVQSAYLSFIQERNLSSAFMGYRGYPVFGIGTSMHMEPPVPCVAPLDINRTPVILPGTLLSIVVMAHASRPVLRIHRDGWSVVDINRALSVLFSHVIVVDRDTTSILTPKLQ